MSTRFLLQETPLSKHSRFPEPPLIRGLSTIRIDMSSLPSNKLIYISSIFTGGPGSLAWNVYYSDLRAEVMIHQTDWYY